MSDTKTFTPNDFIKDHPFFSKKTHRKARKIHLPVAPACNVRHRYDIGTYGCVNIPGPVPSGRVMAPQEAMDRARAVVEKNEDIRVICIAGPGEPLANDAAFETLHVLHKEFPELSLCVSTNGLNLPERLDELMKAGVRSLTVTINAVTPVMAEKIYSWASFKGRRYAGRDAATLILNNQWRGLTNAIDAGLTVKVDTVFIPGVNDIEIPLIAWHAGERGADLMHIIPLLPHGAFEGREKALQEMLSKKRVECGRHIPQVAHCCQCIEGAGSVPSEDREEVPVPCMPQQRMNSVKWFDPSEKDQGVSDNIVALQQ
jgi:nitrogen fixation protein NifB